MLKNSQFTKGANDFKRPFNNVILPIANVNYRTEGFDVKDVELFVNDRENFHKSFLTRKFHTRWARKFSVDTAIDESVESFFDYGIAIAKDVNDKRPEIIQPQQIAFCDITDVLSGPICLKHQYGVDEIQDMKWDKKAVEVVTRNASFITQRTDGKETQTPGKYVEVYELHGVFPESWLPESWLKDDFTYEDTGKYVRQMHIIAYYTDPENGNKTGVHLWRGKQKQVFKALKRDNIHGRACGRGGIEELFHPQVWTNYSEIHLQQMLEAVSKVVLKSTDKQVAKNNNLKNLKHNQIIQLQEGTDIQQMVITAPNKQAFDNFVNKWEQVARTTGSASDPQLGLNSKSGTPLGETQIVTAQGEGIHDYRRGKISVFWGEIYRDWILPRLVEDMLKGDEWVEELTADELREIAEVIIENETNAKLKQKLLSGVIPTDEEQAMFKEVIKSQFAKGGNRRFLKLVRDELKDIPIDVEFNIAGKQAYQQEMVNKLNSVFRSIFANPAILQAPGIGELFNNILESAGLSPIKFAALMQPQPQMAQPQMAPAPNIAPEPAVIS